MISNEHEDIESKIIRERQAMHERLRSKAEGLISVRKQIGNVF